ncbi:hypothetical protein GCM10011585_07120 [Edaphobacter dinghuensis]|uniref:Uncharacterized protein n=1 Tax=Edaphobacter dinghuensis TaxID=1560005 RepID=A0A917LYT5_9BACT|nr:hypothetical protein GCM10011585_07120 [Edaphobacter dinghuensis]
MDCGRAECAVPPLLLRGKDGDVMLDAELAAAMLEVPALFVTYDESAARTGEGEGIRVQATVAQAAALATHSLEQNDTAAGEQA